MSVILKFMMVLVISAVICLSDSNPRDYGDCDAVQYLLLDKTDIIECSFSNFFGVYWYNTTDSNDNYPLVVLEYSKKSGDGYLSGQYDVYPNGSLVINSVSLEDDHSFRVILLQEKKGSSITFEIRAYVVAIDTGEYGACDPLQYLSFGKTDIIECSFSDFYGVYWYNTTDPTDGYPLVVFEDSKKSGDGYLSGQYDVYPNGSLIIKTVSLNDDSSFRVILLQEKRGSSINFDIRVYVVAMSTQPHPFINICGNSSFCFTQLHNQLDGRCVLSQVRPPANLTWVARNEFGDWPIPFQSYVSQHGILYTTEIQTTVDAQDTEYLIHLVCKALSPPDVVNIHEASVLIEFTRTDYSPNESVMSNVEVGKRLTLTCGNYGAGFLSWKKEVPNDYWETIAHVYFGESFYWKIYNDDYDLDKNGSLIVYEADVGTEGVHACIHNVGRTDIVEGFQVKVFVPPQPPFVIIQGCDNHERCTLNVSNEGTVMCSLRGIRPPATLQWLPYPDSSESITFEDCKQAIVKTGDTFEISLTSKFTRKDITKTTLVIECRVFGWNYKIIDMDRKLELQFGNAELKKENENLFVGLGVGGAVGVVIGLCAGFLPLTSKTFRRKLSGWTPAPREPGQTTFAMQNATANNVGDEQLPDGHMQAEDSDVDGYRRLQNSNNGHNQSEHFPYDTCFHKTFDLT